MILGITGPIGCGKSTVLSAFSARNWYVADADRLCHTLYDGSTPELSDKIAARWGKQLLLDDGSVNRNELGRIVFADTEALNELTALLYPPLTTLLTTRIEQCRHDEINGVFELPLLYEGHFELHFDAVVAVWAAEAIRHKRLRNQRGYTQEAIRSREKSQLPAESKLERADYALINNGTPDELNLQIDLLLRNWKAI